MAKCHVGLRWVGGWPLGGVGRVYVLFVLLAGNTAKNSIKKQKEKAGLGRVGEVGVGERCERKSGRAGGGMMAVKEPKPGRWPSAVC